MKIAGNEKFAAVFSLISWVLGRILDRTSGCSPLMTACCEFFVHSSPSGWSPESLRRPVRIGLNLANSSFVIVFSFAPWVDNQNVKIKMPHSVIYSRYGCCSLIGEFKIWISKKGKWARQKSETLRSARYGSSADTIRGEGPLLLDEFRLNR